MIELLEAVMATAFTTLAASIVLFSIAVIINDRNR